MCCYTRVWNYGGLTPQKQELIENILVLAGFTQNPITPSQWRKEFPPRPENDGTLVERAIGIGLENQVNIHLIPTIGDHTQHDHDMVAYQAAFAFKLANIIAEKLDARIQQMCLMGDCKMESLTNHGVMHKELADHALQLEFKFDNMCLGFRQALLEGVYQPDIRPERETIDG